ncbi:hypothetical protein ACLOJK_014605 [Asimina triloba]
MESTDFVWNLGVLKWGPPCCDWAGADQGKSRLDLLPVVVRFGDACGWVGRSWTWRRDRQFWLLENVVVDRDLGKIAHVCLLLARWMRNGFSLEEEAARRRFAACWT